MCGIPPTMDFPQPLIPARLVARYKRFFADVVTDDGREITAHCPNPGAMLGLNTPGLPAWISASDNPRRKLAQTLELVEADGGLVGINTMHPNRLVAEALAADAIPELTGYTSHRREVKYGKNSRIDLLLEDPDKGLCYVEIKNVHMMRRDGLAEFPDSITERGAKHLAELSDMVGEGHRAVMIFLIQRTDAKRLTLARDVDAAYGAAFDAAAAAGVETLAYSCKLSPQEIAIDKRVPVKA